MMVGARMVGCTRMMGCTRGAEHMRAMGGGR